MYAIIETGGKQYKVQEGDVLFIEKLNANEGESITFDQVVAIGKEDGFVAGTPLVSGASVSATVDKQLRGKKLIVFKYKDKNNDARKRGHRQAYTKLVIEAINA